MATKRGRPRLLTGVAGLDDILHGGLPLGHVYLIEGDPGSGKTTLGIQFLLAGIANKEPALYVTLAESREELQAVADSHDFRHLEDGDLRGAASRAGSEGLRSIHGFPSLGGRTGGRNAVHPHQTGAGESGQDRFRLDV
jgi:hypothetical protein